MDVAVRSPTFGLRLGTRSYDAGLPTVRTMGQYRVAEFSTAFPRELDPSRSGKKPARTVLVHDGED